MGSSEAGNCKSPGSFWMTPGLPLLTWALSHGPWYQYLLRKPKIYPKYKVFFSYKFVMLPFFLSQPSVAHTPPWQRLESLGVSPPAGRKAFARGGTVDGDPRGTWVRQSNSLQKDTGWEPSKTGLGSSNVLVLFWQSVHPLHAWPEERPMAETRDKGDRPRIHTSHLQSWSQIIPPKHRRKQAKSIQWGI